MTGRIETITVQPSTDEEAGTLDLKTCDARYALSWLFVQPDDEEHECPKDSDAA